MEQELFKIEKGIPVPFGAIKKVCPFPFDKMNVGDSFKIPNEVPRSTLTVWIQRYRQTHPDVKIITRKIGDEIRCWRIK